MSTSELMRRQAGMEFRRVLRLRFSDLVSSRPWSLFAKLGLIPGSVLGALILFHTHHREGPWVSPHAAIQIAAVGLLWVAVLLLISWRWSHT